MLDFINKFKHTKRIGWAIENPLMGLGAIFFVVASILVVWEFSTKYTSNKKYVTVDTFSLDESITKNNVTLHLKRITSQPKFHIRLSAYSEKKSEPYILIDGYIENKTSKTITYFFYDDNGIDGVKLENTIGEFLNTRARFTGNRCEDKGILIKPNKTVKFSIPIKNNDDNQWVKNSIMMNEISSIDLSNFSFSECGLSKTNENWNYKFTSIPLINLEKRFGAPVLEAYGMTEASHQMSSNPLPPNDRKPGSVGKSTGVEINIMSMETSGVMLANDEIGEVVIKGENVTSGYHNNEDANKDAFVNGWFRTGDQGYLDDEGYLNLTGRIKELINRGGEKISPLEVDAILINHPSVDEAVCYGFPDEKYGEVVHAALVTNSNITESEIKDFCSKSLASFKVPEIINFTDKLPRTATGKIQRRIVAKHFNN